MWQTLVFDYRPNGCLHHHPQKQNAHRGKHSRQQRFQCNLQSSREKLNILLFYLHKPKKITTFAVEFLKTYIAYGIKLTTFANKQQSFQIIKL